MNALFPKDLANKTRRGMRGKLEKGKAVAGISYGYRVTTVGMREINEPEAPVVRRIFDAYSEGLSPRAIARMLNRENVPGPGGRLWGPSTIVGNRYRGIGVLNNELYVGVMVWNRQRFIKDPDTRKRLARPNPPEDWIRVTALQLRIIGDEVWQRVKERQGAYEKKPFMHRRRPKHFLSGLLKCGCCGGGVSAINKTQLGCTGARDRADVYRRRIAELAKLLEGDGPHARSARQDVRSLIDRIVVTPAPEKMAVDLIGDLGGILTFASEGRYREVAVAHPSAPMVAGHRTQLYRTVPTGLFRGRA